MANSQTNSTGQYDPIKMLNVYLADNPNAPSYLTNYLLNRMGDQIKWYDKRSSFFKKKWEGNRMWVIILSASIPFLVGLMGSDMGGEKFNHIFDVGLKLVVGTAGVFIAILEGLNTLRKSQDLYVDYRATAEQMRQEFGFFLGKAGEYHGLSNEGAYARLIANTEAIMVSQNSRWAEMARQKEKSEIAAEIQDAMEEIVKEQGAKLFTPPPPPPPAPKDTEQGETDTETDEEPPVE